MRCWRLYSGVGVGVGVDAMRELRLDDYDRAPKGG